MSVDCKAYKAPPVIYVKDIEQPIELPINRLVFLQVNFMFVESISFLIQILVGRPIEPIRPYSALIKQTIVKSDRDQWLPRFINISIGIQRKMIESRLLCAMGKLGFFVHANQMRWCRLLSSLRAQTYFAILHSAHEHLLAKH